MLDKKDIEKLSEVFTTREEIMKLATKDDVVEFKNEILDGQDKILGKLEMLVQEKLIGDEQDKRQKRVLEIHNKALKKNKILTGKETLEIDGLRVF